MGWADEMQTVTDDVIENFSDSIDYTQSTSSVTLTVNFDRNHTQVFEKLDGSQVESVIPLLRISKTEAATKLTTIPRRNDTFDFDSKTYVVEEVKEFQTFWELTATEVR